MALWRCTALGRLTQCDHDLLMSKVYARVPMGAVTSLVTPHSRLGHITTSIYEWGPQ